MKKNNNSIEKKIKNKSKPFRFSAEISNILN